MTKKFIEVDEMTQMLLEKLIESENAKPREIEYDTDPKPYEIRIATKWQEENDALRLIASRWLLRGALQDGYVDEGNDVVSSALIRSLDDAEAAIERVIQATEPESPETDEVPDLIKLLQSIVYDYKTGSMPSSLLMLQAEGGVEELVGRWMTAQRNVIKKDIRAALDGER